MRSRHLAVAFVTLAVGAPAALANSILSPADQRVNQATPMIISGRMADAEPLLRAAIALDPNDSEAHYNLAVVLRATNRFPEAIGEYRAAEQLYAADDEPNRAKCLYGIALATESLGDPARAMTAWDEYVRFDSRFAHAQPAVAIAREHLVQQQNLAAAPTPPPGTQKAGR
jgi:tetratricopeptide (TPR) repeat protein